MQGFPPRSPPKSLPKRIGSYLYQRACGSKGFPGQGFSPERALEASGSGGCICHELLLRNFAALQPSAAGAVKASACTAAPQLAASWQGRVVAGALLATAEARRELLRYQLARTGGSHGRSRCGTAGKSAGGSWHPWLRPSHAAHRAREQGCLGGGQRARRRTQGACFATATRQLGVWLNCSAVAKEPRHSQETDGYTQ